MSIEYTKWGWFHHSLFIIIWNTPNAYHQAYSYRIYEMSMNTLNVKKGKKLKNKKWKGKFEKAEELITYEYENGAYLYGIHTHISSSIYTKEILLEKLRWPWVSQQILHTYLQHNNYLWSPKSARDITNSSSSRLPPYHRLSFNYIIRSIAVYCQCKKVEDSARRKAEDGRRGKCLLQQPFFLSAPWNNISSCSSLSAPPYIFISSLELEQDRSSSFSYFYSSAHWN